MKKLLVTMLFLANSLLFSLPLLASTKIVFVNVSPVFLNSTVLLIQFSILEFIAILFIILLVALLILVGVRYQKMFKTKVNESNEYEQMFQLIAESVNDVICKTNLDGTIEYASPNFLKHFGHLPSNLIGHKFLELVKEKDHSLFSNIFSLANNNSTVIDQKVEFHYNTASGNYRLAEAFCSTISKNNNIPTNLLFSIRDVTELKKSQEQLYFTQFAIDNVRQMVIIIDPIGNIVYLNNVMKQLVKRMRFSESNLKLWDISSDVTAENWPRYFNDLRENKYKIISSEITTPAGNRYIERHATYAKHNNREYIITNSVDLTDYFITENKLRQSEKMYRTIVENIYDVVWIIDLNLKTTFITPSIERLTGYTVEEHLNQSIADKFTRESSNKIKQWYEYYIPKLVSNELDRKEFIVRGEFEYKKKGGGEIWVEMTIKMLLDENGQITGIHGTSVNIDERKHTEIELRSSREKYKSIYENIIDVYYECSLNGILIEISPSFEKLSKYKCSEVIGVPIINFYKNPDHRENVILELHAKGSISNYNVTLVDKDGREIECSLTSSLIRDENGNPSKICGTIRDVSERILSDKIIKENEERYKTLVSLSPNTIAVSRHGKLIFVNPAGIKMLGYSDAEDVIGKDLLSYIHPDEHEFLLNFFYKYDKSLENRSFEVRVLKRDGRIINTATYIQPIEYSHEPAMLIVAQDITTQKIFETELTQAKQKAEESDMLKTAFLANMSHEIRTPLNGIIGFAGLLNKTNISKDKLEHYTQIINSSSHQLLGIINDIIDISKIEAGQMIVMLEPLNLNHLFDEICSIYKTLAEKRNIKFNLYKALPNENAVINSDELKIKQVLNNLLNNALKFTNSGNIDLAYEINGEEILVTIRDSGIGIPEDYQRVIFERFRQVEIANNRKYGGTGLGLSISKALIEMLGGKIWLESVPNLGTTFYFTIPFSNIYPEEQIKTQEISVDEDYDWAKKTILIAEDESMNYYFLEELLHDTGVMLIHAENGRQAIQLFKKHSEIDLVMLDIKMPELDGYQTLKEIKKLRPNISIIAQTAFAMSNDKDKALARGFDDYIPKPIDKDDLLAIVNKHLYK